MKEPMYFSSNTAKIGDRVKFTARHGNEFMGIVVDIDISGRFNTYKVKDARGHTRWCHPSDVSVNKQQTL